MLISPLQMRLKKKCVPILGSVNSNPHNSWGYWEYEHVHINFRTTSTRSQNLVLSDSRVYLQFIRQNDITRSTQRVQTSLAEADQYSHTAHCKNVEPWLWKTTDPPTKKKRKKKRKKKPHLHQDLGMLQLLWWIFAHLVILQYPDHHQNLISSFLYYSEPLHKISSQSVHNFLSNVVHRQTN